MSRYMWPSSLDHMYKHITIFPVWIFFSGNFFFWFGMQYHICMHLMPPNVSFSQNLSYTLFITFFKRTLKTLKTDKILSNEFFYVNFCNTGDIKLGGAPLQCIRTPIKFLHNYVKCNINIFVTFESTCLCETKQNTK